MDALGKLKEPTLPCFCQLPVVGICLQLHALIIWHHWTWVMKDRSASWIAVSIIACWVVCYGMSTLFLWQQHVCTYILNGNLIGGSSRLHTTPWMRRTTSSISQSSDSWTPNFQLPLPPISIGLQSSLMLSAFWYNIGKQCLNFGLMSLWADLQKIASCLPYWLLVFRTFIHFSSRSPILNGVIILIFGLIKFTYEHHQSHSVHPLEFRWKSMKSMKSILKLLV